VIEVMGAMRVAIEAIGCTNSANCGPVTQAHSKDDYATGGRIPALHELRVQLKLVT
jgi:hypothetical protein